MTDKTNYAQSLMHMIKGNLGTGILAMPASFAHTGLYNALYGLPFLCLISTYCVHLLVKSSQQVESKTKGITSFKYASLAKHSFKNGPIWLRSSSSFMCMLVDGILLIAQIGVCCVYLVFVVENITSILGSYYIQVSKTLVFIAIFPIALLLSFIKTLKRLAIASGFANFLQAVGISIILEYLIRDINKINLDERDKFRSFESTALGFGSAMFAFEGISVVLPVYSRMKNSNRMSGWNGVVNLSYVILLILYFAMGLFGFLKFGRDAKDSITLNLPPKPIYDAVRAIFAVSVFLTYPLQFYVPNEIIWNWAKKNLLMVSTEKVAGGEGVSGKEISLTPVVQTLEIVTTIKKNASSEKPPSFSSKVMEDEMKVNGFNNTKQPATLMVEKKVQSSSSSSPTSYMSEQQLNKYEYYCRTLIVILTFLLAISVPKLNLLMDLIGSISGTALSLIIPATIHMAAFWDNTKGFKKTLMILIDSSIILFGLAAGISGTIFSSLSIINSFSNDNHIIQ